MEDEERTPAPEADPTVRAAFVASQVAGLRPLDYFEVALVDPPHDSVHVRREDDGTVAVEVADRDPGAAFSTEQVAGLNALGFNLKDATWVAPEAVEGHEAVAVLVERTLAEVFGLQAGRPVDIRHGSTREEHEARRKVESMRACIEPVLASIVGHPAPQDSDGDYLVDMGSTRVFVAPRARPDRPPIIRVFAITNANLNLTSELGLFLCRLNFNLMFGRFSIDMEHRALWFDETLLGDHVTDEELRFTVEMVASTAGEWDHKIAQIFGGTVRQPQAPPEAVPPSKPGQGGYL